MQTSLRLAIAFCAVVAVSYFSLQEPKDLEGTGSGVEVGHELFAPEDLYVPHHPIDPELTVISLNRRTAVSSDGYEFAPDKRIQGRVQFPPGTPEGEAYEVVLSASLPLGVGDATEGDGIIFSFFFDPQEVARATVGADGAFDLPLPTNAEFVYLSVEGGMLLLDYSPTLSVAQRLLPQTVTPTLGARITLSLLPPAESKYDFEQLVGRKIALEGDSDGPSTGWPYTVEATIDDDLQASFLVSTDFRSYSIPGYYEDSSISPGLAPFVAPITWSYEPTAGEHAKLQLQLENGLHVAGTVVDSSGEPVSGVLVRATSEYRSGLMGGSRSILSQSDSHGTFELSGVQPGLTRLAFTHRGYVPGELGPSQLGTGLERTGIRFELAGGACFAGTVRLPDGRVVPDLGISVRLTSGVQKGQEYHTITEPNGSFRINGIIVGNYTLSAAARFDPDSSPSVTGPDRLVPAKPIRWQTTSPHPVLRVHRIGVPTGSENLDLVLEPTPSLKVHVIDDIGQPVSSFKLAGFNGAEHRRGSFGKAPRSGITQRVETQDGAYDWQGLAPGSWIIWAERGQHMRSESLSVQLDQVDRNVVLILPRPASISGFVHGIPAGAKVTVRGKRLLGAGLHTSEGSAVCDAAGFFELKDLTPGRYELSASGFNPGQLPAYPKQYFPVARESVEVASGDALDWVSLAVAKSGFIKYEVQYPDGSALQNAHVSAITSSNQKLSWNSGSAGPKTLGPCSPGEATLTITYYSENGTKSKSFTEAVTVGSGETIEIMLVSPTGPL